MFHDCKMAVTALRPALAQVDRYQASVTSRRCFLSGASATLALAPLSARADEVIKLPLPGGPDERPITTSFPQKGALILQRTRPPLLETPFEVFDQSVFTPNDRFFVRWHWAVIPNEINVDNFRLGYAAT